MLNSPFDALSGMPGPFARRRRPQPFDPASLFASGEQGAWYDPSDLRTLFQDDAGTTPVTEPGQTVGLMLDKRLGLVRGDEILDAEGVGARADWDGTSVGGTIDISGDELVVSNPSSSQWTALIGFGTLKANKSYEIIVTLSFVESGSFNVQTVNEAQDAVTSLGVNNVQAEVGAFRFIAPNLSDDGYFRIRHNASSTYTISNVSIRELPGNHATQPTAESRPVYQAGGGLHWLEFDGVDDFLETADFGIHAEPTTYVAATKITDEGSNAYVVDRAIGEDRQFIRWRDTGGTSPGYQLRGFNFRESEQNPAILSLICDGGNSIFSANSIEKDFSNATSVFSKFYIGARFSQQEYLSGNVYTLTAINRRLSSDELQKLRNLAALRSGVTL